MTLEVDVERSLGSLDLSARFAADRGVTALFGRSGSGKTSIVNAIAGLLTPERGRIVLDGRVLFDSSRGTDLPRHRRRLGYVFQDARLFPHLTVRQNLGFGRWFAPANERRGSLAEVAALLGLEPLLARRPGTLSGGERQRVAIGRALLASPRLLLMDEPLASLDGARKAEILPYLDRLRQVGIPIVFVSHALDEVARLADTLVVLSAGKVVAAGPLADIMGRLDLTPMTGRAEAGSVLTATVGSHDEGYALTRLDLGGQSLLVPRIDEPVGATVRIRVRARDVAVALQPPAGTSYRNVLRGRVVTRHLEPGAFAEIGIDLGPAILRARLTRHAADELDLQPGREVTALVRAVAVDRRQISPVAAS